MKPRTFVAPVSLVCAVFLAIIVATLSAAPTVHPTGVTIHDPHKTYRGNIIYTPPGAGKAYMVDADGNFIHEWRPEAGEAIGYARPLDQRGHLLGWSSAGGARRAVEMDAHSQVVWQFVPPPDTIIHHDISRLPNGNTLMLCYKNFIDLEISDKELRDDCLIEVDENGTIVWEWQTADHIEDFGFTQEVRDLIYADGGDWAHANAAAVIPPNMTHTDPRFAPGNIIVSYRRISTIAIIRRSTGDIVWTSDVTNGQHDSHMLPDGLAGAGNILVFDNGNGDGYSKFGSNHSRILEIDPTDKSIAWEYDATASGRPVWTFDSWFISSVQRLPNGNTLICEGAFGRIFEIDPAGEIVWEFLNPIMNGNPPSNRVYRAHKVSLNWLPSS